MVKDNKNGEILRADHLVEEVLEARLKGDKEARGQAVEQKDDEKAKKKKKKGGAVQAIKLEDAVVQEYEEVLAKVCNSHAHQKVTSDLTQRRRSTTMVVRSSVS
jgi:glycyl-tRNA synthetase